MAGWQLRGTIVIACNCDWGCPCNFNARPSRGHCQGGWIWIADEGRYDDVTLDGLGFSVFAQWPGAIHEGGGTAVAFLDERADDAQREAITTLVRGEDGGPWGIFINTYALDGPRPRPFDVQLDGYSSTIRIGESVALELDTIRNPVTGADAHPEMVLPEGMVTKRGALAASKHFHVDDGLTYDHSGQYAAFGAFDYASA